MEDVTPAENQEALRLVREHTTTPIAIGEVFNSVWDYRDLVREQLIDYVRASVAHAGGITGLRRIFDYAAMYQIKSGSHGPTDISPVGSRRRCTSTSRSTTSASRSTWPTSRSRTKYSARRTSSMAG